MASALGIYVGRSTLLRLVRALPDPPTTTVEVLGVDDFKLGRRHRYGTVLIDMDTHRPVDVLLPTGKPKQSPKWLTEHPGTQVICRDSAGAYAEAARAGAPEAIEVADRRHLWHNLAEAVRKTVAAHHNCLKNPEFEPEPSIERTASKQLKQVAEQVHTTRPESSMLVIRTKNRFQAVETLKNEGMGIRTIARQLELARETVRRFYYANSVDELLGHREPACQLCWTSSPNIFTSVSTTAMPTLLHFTKNFKNWDIAAAIQLRSGLPSPVSQDRGSSTVHTERCRKGGGSPRGCRGIPTTSPTMGRSGSSRFSPAAGTSKQLQAMSSRLQGCSPDALANN